MNQNCNHRCNFLAKKPEDGCFQIYLTEAVRQSSNRISNPMTYHDWIKNRLSSSSPPPRSCKLDTSKETFHGTCESHVFSWYKISILEPTTTTHKIFLWIQWQLGLDQAWERPPIIRSFDLGNGWMVIFNTSYRMRISKVSLYSLYCSSTIVLVYISRTSIWNKSSDFVNLVEELVSWETSTDVIKKTFVAFLVSKKKGQSLDLVPRYPASSLIQ